MHHISMSTWPVYYIDGNTKKLLLNACLSLQPSRHSTVQDRTLCPEAWQKQTKLKKSLFQPITQTGLDVNLLSSNQLTSQLYCLLGNLTLD